MNQVQPNSEESPTHEAKVSRSSAEWVTFGVASVILATVVGLVLYVWLGQQDQQPPTLLVSHDKATRQVNRQFYVPFTLVHQGGKTVESVRVIAELRINNVEETAEEEINFLASGETAEGAFIFSHPPQDGELSIRVASYKLP